MRDIDSEVQAASEANGAYEVQFAELIISESDELRLSSLYKDVSFNTFNNGVQNFSGAGHLIRVSSLTDTLDAKQTTINVSLTGLDPIVVSQITTVPFLGSEINLYRGYYDEEEGRLIGTPYLAWRGIANDYSTVYGGSIGQENMVTVTVACKNLIVSILEAEKGRYTSTASFRAARVEDASDLSMEFVAQMSSFNPQFGRES